MSLHYWTKSNFYIWLFLRWFGDITKTWVGSPASKNDHFSHHHPSSGFSGHDFEKRKTPRCRPFFVGSWKISPNLRPCTIRLLRRRRRRNKRWRMLWTELRRCTRIQKVAHYVRVPPRTRGKDHREHNYFFFAFDAATH